MIKFYVLIVNTDKKQSEIIEYFRDVFSIKKSNISVDKVLQKVNGIHLEMSIKGVKIDDLVEFLQLINHREFLYHLIYLKEDRDFTNDYLNLMEIDTKNITLVDDSLVNYADLYPRILCDLEKNLNSQFLTCEIDITSLGKTFNDIVIVDPIPIAGFSLIDKYITSTDKSAWLNNLFIFKINLKTNGYLCISDVEIDPKLLPRNEVVLKCACKECLEIIDSLIENDNIVLKNSLKTALNKLK